MKATTVVLTVTLLLIATQVGAFAATINRTIASRDISPRGGAQSQELTITVSPHNPPVTLPSSGGSFDFRVEIENVGPASAGFETWTLLEYPDGALAGPLLGPLEFLLPSAWSSSNDLSQELASDAPAGTYVFHVYAGQYPGIIWATDTFSFEKEEATPAWYPQSAGTTNSLFAVYFTDRDNGWISGMLNTILHTTDGGDNWYPQPAPPSSHYYDLHFVDPLEGWAVGSSGKIAHTEDGGESWALQPSGTTYNFYGVHFLNASTGWAVGGREADFSPARRFVLRTTDGGDTWVTQLFESYKNPFKDVHFADANHGWAVGEFAEVVHTADGGATWTEQEAPSSGQLTSVFFLDSLNGWITGATGNLLYTTNGGATWQHADIDTTAHLTDVVFADAQNGWVVGGDGLGGAIFRTTDGGASWYQQEAAGAQFIYGAFFTDASAGWAVGYNGTIVRTQTGGN
jgi:photosystem II stability/assembly factor-like uncharacterized protein